MSKYFDLIKPAIDSYGLIAQLPSNNRDGGDTAQREGMFGIFIAWLYKLGKIDQVEYESLKKRYEDNLAKLECSWGNLKRHVDTSMWYSFCDRMSRDQWISNIIAMGMLSLKKALLKMLIGHLKRALLFTTNTRHNWVYPPEHPKHTPDQDYSWKLPDITVLACWGAYIRGFRALPLYPLLLIFDLDILFNSCIWLWKFKYKPNDTDILNHLNMILQARTSMPTPISWIARKMLNVNKVQECLNGYFLPDGPALHEISKDFLKDIW